MCLQGRICFYRLFSSVDQLFIFRGPTCIHISSICPCSFSRSMHSVMIPQTGEDSVWVYTKSLRICVVGYLEVVASRPLIWWYHLFSFQSGMVTWKRLTTLLTFLPINIYMFDSVSGRRLYSSEVNFTVTDKGNIFCSNLKSKMVDHSVQVSDGISQQRQYYLLWCSRALKPRRSKAAHPLYKIICAPLVSKRFFFHPTWLIS